MLLKVLPANRAVVPPAGLSAKAPAAGLFVPTVLKTLLLRANADDSDSLYSSILACARKNGTRVVELSEPSLVRAGDLSMDVFCLPGGQDENERCLMAMLHAGGLEVLVTADASDKMERSLTAAEDLSEADVLIVSHHGSRYASCDELLREVRGRTAVISTGYNRFGHPADETLDRLAEYGYTIQRTDRDGTIEIR